MILICNDCHEKKVAWYKFEDDLDQITLLHQNSTRPKDWTHIVNCSGHGQLAYNFDKGRAEYYGVQDGIPRRLLHYTTLPKGWTHILQEGVTADSVLPLLFFYNSETGDASFYAINREHSLDQLAGTTLLSGWTHILPFDLNLIMPPHSSYNHGLFFYNSQNGLTQIYDADDRGSIREVFSTTLSMGWTHIVPIDDLAGPTSQLLFYKKNTGDVALYKIDRQNTISRVSSDRWDSGWTQIHFGIFSPCQQENATSALLFYNGSTGVTQLYRLNNVASISQISHTTLFPGWTQMIWLTDAQGGDL